MFLPVLVRSLFSKVIPGILLHPNKDSLVQWLVSG